MSELPSRRLEELFLRHADGAGRLAYLLTGDRDLADDLVQDAFVRVARRLVHLRDPDAFGAYLRRTVVNLARSQFRRRRVERAHLARRSSERAEPWPSTSPAAADRLGEALALLTPRQRTAVVLRYYEDLSIDRTAEIMRCRPGTVKALVSQALSALREVIVDE